MTSPPPIGHNQPPPGLDIDAANQATGVILLCKEFLVTAIGDKKLERSHLRVLACIVRVVNHNARAWPSRAFIAFETQLSLKTVSNLLTELRQWGYLITSREEVPEANNRNLTVYRLGNIDHEMIRMGLDKVVLALEGKATSPPTGNSPVPQASPPVGNFPARREQNTPELPRPRGTDFPAHGELPLLRGTDNRPSSPPTGTRKKDSITTVENLELEGGEAAKRGKRLPDDWQLPLPYGQWARENFQVSDEQIRAEGKKFANYWIAKSGKDACKRDWFRTWQNWCQSDFIGWKPRKAPLRIGESPLGAKSLQQLDAEEAAEREFLRQQFVKGTGL